MQKQEYKYARAAENIVEGAKVYLNPADMRVYNHYPHMARKAYGIAMNIAKEREFVVIKVVA